MTTGASVFLPSEYTSHFNSSEIRLYSTKLERLNISDPYNSPGVLFKSITSCSEDDVPDLRYADIHSYLVSFPSVYSGDSLRAYKSLEAYKWCQSGFVNNIQLWSLTSKNFGIITARVNMFAPNMEQMHVVNHLKGEPSEEKRNVLVESARLARGNIQDLSKLSAKDHDAIILPGGFGAAKNLCTWAVKGKDCTVNDEVKAVLQAFHGEGKPIGLCCISPVIAAKVFPGCEVTVGIEKDDKYPNTTDTAAAITELGCKHVSKSVSESHVDEKNKLVTTSAFMCEAPIHEIYDGIGTMVQDVLKLA